MTPTSSRRALGTIHKAYRITCTRLTKAGTTEGLPEHLGKSCWGWGRQCDPLLLTMALSRTPTGAPARGLWVNT